MLYSVAPVTEPQVTVMALDEPALADTDEGDAGIATSVVAETGDDSSPYSEEELQARTL
jgi:hypothetical protein